jgi:ABC-type oligopeptide transport system substrate-binding subunit
MKRNQFLMICLFAVTLAISACASQPCADNGKTAEMRKNSPLAEKIAAEDPPDYLPEQEPQQPVPANKKGTP